MDAMTSRPEAPGVRPSPGYGAEVERSVWERIGRSMRFEEGEDQKWQQVPQTANPLLMVRK